MLQEEKEQITAYFEKDNLVSEKNVVSSKYVVILCSYLWADIMGGEKEMIDKTINVNNNPSDATPLIILPPDCINK
jgi:hypothetical protein